MTAAENLPLMSVEDYLTAEEGSEVRHEYLGGNLYAMAGARTVHDRISGSFHGSIYGQLRGKPCEPFTSDMKVRVQMTTHTRFYYPDGMVVCEPKGPEVAFQDQPVVIAEVLSESTRRTDEGEKRDAYLSIPSLRVYLLIESDQPRAVAYRRDPNGAFVAELYTGTQATIDLPEIEVTLSLSELYERVEFGSTDDDD